MNIVNVGINNYITMLTPEQLKQLEYNDRSVANYHKVRYMTRLEEYNTFFRVYSNRAKILLDFRPSTRKLFAHDYFYTRETYDEFSEEMMDREIEFGFDNHRDIYNINQ